jgi:hypothetical protein
LKKVGSWSYRHVQIHCSTLLSDSSEHRGSTRGRLGHREVHGQKTILAYEIAFQRQEEDIMQK